MIINNKKDIFFYLVNLNSYQFKYTTYNKIVSNKVPYPKKMKNSLIISI